MFLSLVRVVTEGAGQSKGIYGQGAPLSAQLGVAVKTPGVKQQRNPPRIRPLGECLEEEGALQET